MERKHKGGRPRKQPPAAPPTAPPVQSDDVEPEPRTDPQPVTPYWPDRRGYVEGAHNVCKTCRHPRRTEIESDWIDCMSYADLGQKYGMSAMALRNHFVGRKDQGDGERCESVTNAMVLARDKVRGDMRAADLGGVTLADALTERVETLVQKASDMLDEVRGDEMASGRDKAAMIVALKGCLELLAKLHGRLQSVEINVSESPMFLAFVNMVHSVVCTECRRRIREEMQKTAGVG